MALKFPKNRTGIVSEQRTGKRINMKETAASGAMLGFKGDLRDDQYMVECKSTVNASMSLKLAWLRKVAAEALQEGLIPALHLAFTHGDGHPVKNGTWVMMREQDYLELVDRAKEGDSESEIS